MKSHITLDESLDNAIAQIKNSAYKGTAIKIELEAQLNRDDGGYSNECYDCEGRGVDDCSQCYNDETWEYDGCDECDHTGEITCESCEGSGRASSDEYQGDEWCEDFLHDHVSAEARNAIVFGRFYNDGSVDSEFTFTMMIENVRYAVEYVKAFKALADEIGNGLDTRGAGMHMALLNSSNGHYPSGNKIDSRHFSNFAKSMLHFLPTLYFLGSSDHRARGLNYRNPKIEREKYSAIHGHRDGAIEFRFFETCYDRPEALLDNLCVMAKCIQFYSKEQKTLPFFGKVGEVRIAGKAPHLQSYFYSEKHLEALDKGLAVLKPDHKTIKELKKERNFTVNRGTLKKQLAKKEGQWREEYYHLRKKYSAKELEKLATQYKADAERQYDGYYSRHVSSGALGNVPDRQAWVEQAVKEALYSIGAPNLPKRVTSYVVQKRREFLQPNNATKVMV